MIPDLQFERLAQASKQTKTQLRVIGELESSIDEKFRAIIRHVVVNEIDEAIKQLKNFDPSIDLDNPTHNARDRFNRETWIDGTPSGIIYRFYVRTMEIGFFRQLAIKGGTSSAYLPARVFMQMIIDLKASITKGDMDQQIHSKTDTIIYTRMRQVEETLIPEWRKQEDPKYIRERERAQFRDKTIRSLFGTIGADKSSASEEKRTKD